MSCEFAAEIQTSLETKEFLSLSAGLTNVVFLVLMFKTCGCINQCYCSWYKRITVATSLDMFTSLNGMDSGSAACLHKMWISNEKHMTQK